MSSSSLRSLAPVAVSVCALVVLGCSSSDDARGGDSGSGQAVIGPLGGTVEVTDANHPLRGLKITVPPGAVAQDTAFSIESAMDAPALPTGLSGDYPAVTLGPGMTFPKYLQLTFPVTYVPTGDGDILGAYCWNAASGRWVVIPARWVGDGQLIVATNELGLCRWGTIRLGQVDDETVRAWMNDLQRMFDDWDELEAALLAKLQPFISVIENPASFYRCDTQDAILRQLAAWREEALREMTAYLQSPTVMDACRVCGISIPDLSNTCQPSVCDADAVISGQPIEWLQEEVRIWLQDLFWSSSCPVDVLGPIAGKVMAWAKYREAITRLACDWRCVLRNGTPEFYGSLLLGNACSFSILAIELYQSHNPCP